MRNNCNAAFIIGAALGDGNLSNPNGRAIRLRITCDAKYPKVIQEIVTALQVQFPFNCVSTVERKDNCVDVSVYTNKLAELLPWQTNAGSKYTQSARVPLWIFESTDTAIACLRGLVLTDGSIYQDRGYRMINICTNIPALAEDILTLSTIIGFTGTLSITKQPSGKAKHTIRFAKDTARLMQILAITEKR